MRPSRACFRPVVDEVAFFAWVHSLLPRSGGAALGSTEFMGAPEEVFRAVLIPFAAPNYGQMEQAAHFSHGLIETAPELALGGFRFAPPLVNHADVVMRHQVLWRECDGLFEVIRGFFQLPGVKQGHRQPIVCGVVVRVNLQATAKGADGFLHVAAVVPGNAQIVMRQYKSGSCCRRYLIALDSQIERALMEVERA